MHHTLTSGSCHLSANGRSVPIVSLTPEWPALVLQLCPQGNSPLCPSSRNPLVLILLCPTAAVRVPLTHLSLLGCADAGNANESDLWFLLPPVSAGRLLPRSGFVMGARPAGLHGVSHAPIITQYRCIHAPTVGVSAPDLTHEPPGMARKHVSLSYLCCACSCLLANYYILCSV